MNEMAAIANTPSLERRLAGRLEHRLAVLAEEYLDQWGDLFVFYRVRDILGITFEQFLTGPEYFIAKTCALLRIALRDGDQISEIGGRNFYRCLASSVLRAGGAPVSLHQVINVLSAELTKEVRTMIDDCPKGADGDDIKVRAAIAIGGLLLAAEQLALIYGIEIVKVRMNPQAQEHVHLH